MGSFDTGKIAADSYVRAKATLKEAGLVTGNGGSVFVDLRQYAIITRRSRPRLFRSGRKAGS